MIDFWVSGGDERVGRSGNILMNQNVRMRTLLCLVLRQTFMKVAVMLQPSHLSSRLEACRVVNTLFQGRSTEIVADTWGIRPAQACQYEVY